MNANFPRFFTIFNRRKGTMKINIELLSENAKYGPCIVANSPMLKNNFKRKKIIDTV